MSNRPVLVTGASGFVGHALCAELARRGHPTRGTVRSHASKARLRTDVEPVLLASIDGSTDWSEALRGIDVVIHLAARVHVMRDKVADPLAEFRRTNVDGTLSLARQAAASGVKRLVFLSSVKVNGEATHAPHPGPLPKGAREPFRADDAPAPQDPYGISKMEAEQGLWQIAAQTGMDVVVIRPALVYGQGVKANFQAMMRWLSRGVPLPLGAVTHNRRSLVALDNLVDLIVTCTHHPAAANQTFLVSDGEDLSTTDLLRRMGQALGKPARLLPVPPALLKLGAALIGKPELAQRLCGNLQMDISKTRELLGWVPPVPVDEGLRRAVEQKL